MSCWQTPDETPLAPLIEHMLLAHTDTTEVLWRHAGLDKALLRDALPSLDKSPPRKRARVRMCK
jgi:hypothetical protein